MMMVLCFLMSIPLKMMAETVTIHFVDKDGWGDYAAYVYDKTKPDDGSNLVTGGWPGQKVTNNEDIETLANGYKVVTWTIDLKTFELSNLLVIFNNNNNNKQCPASGGWGVKNGLYYYKDGTTSTTPPSGESTGGGSEGGGSTDPTEKWDTEKTNRLTGKKYTQGFYLAGNFFSFQPKEGANQITYDDAVFKFQQQKNDATIESGKDYEVYKVEIPASLTAHGQVMYVDEFGKIKNIFGPGKYSISRTCPETDKSKGWLEAKPYVCDPITNKEIDNCWEFVSRNEGENEYSDGMYNLYIAVDSKTHTVKKWKIEHDSDKRVAYFISDAPDATAMPLYDAYDKNVKYFSNRFYASANISAGRNYYVISNYVLDRSLISYTKDNYGTIENNKNYLSTANKLFLQGNGGYEFSTSDQHNEFSPNEKPMLGRDLGTIIVEYKAKAGNDGSANTTNHLGIRGQVILRDGFKITSVSMVGDAIPGTLKVDEKTGKEVWDYTSNAADMTYDDVEQCYKTTVITTVDEGKKHFRFVGNHDPKINWFEDTDGTEPDKMAKTPLTNSDAKGHTADANDPNKVNYTQGNENPEEKWNIIWNRSAGRWTVRLYFYTYNVAGEPVTAYYYTISANRELELRDFEDVVYKDLNNHRNILLRNGYKYFRTWSAVKAWKISKDVDIFVVDNIDEDGDPVKVSLKKISADETDNVIPSNTGVILATKKTAEEIDGGAQFFERASLTTYNTLVIPIEEYGSTTATTDYAGKNWLETLIEAQVVPTYNKVKDEYNYLFGFYRANKVSNEPYKDNDFLLGFWLSNGTGAFYNNSAYLPISKATAEKMNLGVSYEFLESGGSAKKVPGVIFDFANVGGTTGINEVVNQSAKLNDGKYYTLSGQQVEKPTAGGIYIHNGRKFVVK